MDKLISMQSFEVPFSRVSQLSSRDVSYQENPEKFVDFIEHIPALDSFNSQIEKFRKQEFERDIIVDQIRASYSGLNLNLKQENNLTQLLKEDCFTICTAHQPSLLTGPLYYIYKICSTINLARTLNNTYPDIHVVPCFVHGGEDHDFEEINHLTVFGKTLHWENNEIGPVGRMSLNGIDQLLSELSDILGSSPESLNFTNRLNILKNQSQNYGDFCFKLVHDIFKDTELIQINMDNAKMKSLAVSYFKEDLLNHIGQKSVLKDHNGIEKLGFKEQAHPREINLFYLGTKDRLRIVKENNNYAVLDREIKWSPEELLVKLSSHPEDFSPNVILRPLYQQIVLPNLAYIGGGGELAYWMERRSLFDHFNLPMPLLIRRNSALITNSKTLQTWHKLGFESEQLFDEEHQLTTKFLQSIDDEGLIDINDQREKIASSFDEIATKAEILDKTYVKSIAAEKTRQLKNIDQIQSKLKKLLKQKEDTNINKIKRIKEKHFPFNSLQERKDNFIPYYLRLGPEFIDYLIDTLDPLNKNFKVIVI